MIDWIKLRNEYINGNISYRKLAEKHNISWQTLRDRAVKEKWFDKRKNQRNNIQRKTEQKTAEKLATQEANRLARINKAADKLLDKIEEATEQLDLFLAKDKRRYTQQIRDKNTGKIIDVYVEEEVPKTISTGRINKAELKQIASALKDLRDIQFTKTEDKEQESPNVNITISAATIDDIEQE